MKLKTMPVGNLGTNCYFLINEDTKECIIVDPGDEGKRIVSYLKKEELNVVAILLTHGHADHISALTYLRDFTKAPVYIHIDDENMLTNPKSNLSSFIGEDLSFKKAEFVLESDCQLNLASFKIDVYHTPGHTRGGCCFKLENKVFCGDTIFAESIGRTDLPGGSYSQILKSIKEKILVLDDQVELFPGHGTSTSVGWERRMNPFLK